MKPARPSDTVRAFERDVLPGRVLFGPGSLTRLRGEVQRLPGERVLLVGSSGSVASEQAAALLGSLVAQRWPDVRQHVPVEVADATSAAARQVRADTIVAVGGGSAIGLGKAVALETGLPLLAVPTTYSGSEMTPIHGRTIDGEKRTGRSPRVLPRTVLYDPDLLLTLPPTVVGASGVNALAHCVEALYAPAADPITSLQAVEGVRVLAAALPAAYDRPDPAARAEVLYAACLAGTALGAAGTSLHHGLCHLLGGMYGLPHADTHAVVLPHVVSWVAPSVPAAVAALAGALGVGADDVAGALWDLAARVGARPGLRALGLREEDLDRTAAGAAHLRSPRPLDLPAATELLRAAWSGQRPGRLWRGAVALSA